MVFRLSTTKIALVAVLLLIIGFILAPYFAGVKTISPVALNIGNIPIHWYGITMAIGILSAAFISIKIGLPAISEIDEDQFLSVCLWMIAGGIVGARLLFVALKWSLYAGNPASILQINQGGLSLHGALLGGLIALIIFAKQNKLNWLKLADVTVIGIPVGQAIGRLGNFFNQEAFGGPTNLPWKMYVAPIFRPEHLSQFNFFHPTFAYEALLNLGVFALILVSLKHYKFSGQLFLLYIAAYSLVRFFMEFFRIDSDHWGILSIAQWASLILIIGSIIWYYQLKSKQLGAI